MTNTQAALQTTLNRAKPAISARNMRSANPW